jgi:uncharacterized protein
MTKYVLDTNTIISAHLLKNSIVRDAYDKAFNRGILLYSADTFDEVAKTFSRPKFDKYISIEDRSQAILLFKNKGCLTEVHIKINACRDPKDNKFLELAVSGNASFIITGDKDLLELNPFRNIKIITPTDFVSNF